MMSSINTTSRNNQEHFTLGPDFEESLGKTREFLEASKQTQVKGILNLNTTSSAKSVAATLIEKIQSAPNNARLQTLHKALSPLERSLGQQEVTYIKSLYAKQVSAHTVADLIRDVRAEGASFLQNQQQELKELNQKQGLSEKMREAALAKAEHFAVMQKHAEAWASAQEGRYLPAQSIQVHEKDALIEKAAKEINGAVSRHIMKSMLHPPRTAADRKTYISSLENIGEQLESLGLSEQHQILSENVAANREIHMLEERDELFGRLSSNISTMASGLGIIQHEIHRYDRLKAKFDKHISDYRALRCSLLTRGFSPENAQLDCQTAEELAMILTKTTFIALARTPSTLSSTQQTIDEQRVRLAKATYDDLALPDSFQRPCKIYADIFLPFASLISDIENTSLRANSREQFASLESIFYHYTIRYEEIEDALDHYHDVRWAYMHLQVYMTDRFRESCHAYENIRQQYANQR